MTAALDHLTLALRIARSPRLHSPELTTMVARLRHALGDETYESLAQHGEAMTTGAIAIYAYDQIDEARTELERLQ